MIMLRIPLLCVIIALYSTSTYVSAGIFKNGRFKDGLIRKSFANYDGKLPNDQWFNQRLDHFNPQDMRTWSQRYFVNDTFYKPGGPVFLQIGGEGPADPIWMVTGAWIDYAQMYNALCFQVEHRFYGKSHPTPDISTANLQYLSSEQALEDLANFVATMTADLDLENSKWVAFGGSYPGSLATWFRMKYPHLVHAAVASSAPLVATADFSDYLRVVKESLDTANSQGCNLSIQKATDFLTNMVQDQDGRTLIKAMFRLCDDIDIKNQNDIANLFSSLAGNIEGVVQYNKDNRAFEGAVGTNITIDTLCDIMSQPKSPVENYAQINSLILDTYKEPCLDFKYTNMIRDLQNTSWTASTAEGGRQWTYQTCTEFGYYQTSSYKNQPFGNAFPLPFWTQQCQDIFGPTLTDDVLNAGIKFTNAQYGGLGVKVTRIVFPNGSIDPWHALGVTSDLSPDALALYINGTAHCANMYPPTDADLPQLKAARNTISKLIGYWLQQND